MNKNILIAAGVIIVIVAVFIVIAQLQSPAGEFRKIQPTVSSSYEQRGTAARPPVQQPGANSRSILEMQGNEDIRSLFLIGDDNNINALPLINDPNEKSITGMLFAESESDDASSMFLMGGESDDPYAYDLKNAITNV